MCLSLRLSTFENTILCLFKDVKINMTEKKFLVEIVTWMQRENEFEYSILLWGTSVQHTCGFGHSAIYDLRHTVDGTLRSQDCRMEADSRDCRVNCERHSEPGSLHPCTCKTEFRKSKSNIPVYIFNTVAPVKLE